MNVLGIPLEAAFSQLTLGLINGSFYATMSLGVAIIFGVLRIANFVHGAQYMLGAFCAWFLLNLPSAFPDLGLPSISYWWALLIAPTAVFAVGIVMERLFIRRVYDLDHAYGLLLTIGLSMMIEGSLHLGFGSFGQPYAMPSSLEGGQDLGFIFLPNYRAWVIVSSSVICFGTWHLIERTRLGAYLRAATENPTLVRAFGVNVPRMLMLTYGFGVGLAGLAGVLSAPINQVRPLMGADLIIVVFAVVVIGGMGSIMGSIITGFALGVIEGLTKYFYPEASNTVVFVLMVLVLLVKPTGLTGRAA